jgi:hypothetical protein
MQGVSWNNTDRMLLLLAVATIAWFVLWLLVVLW